MHTKLLIILGIILGIILAVTVGKKQLHEDKIPEVTAPTDYKNATYEIEGQLITLTNGLSEVPSTPDSASLTTTRYFGNEATGDLNGDGKGDVVFLLTQNAGGTGTFYYAVVALQANGGYKGTNGIFLGDRIAPQSTEVSNGEIVVNYADRAPSDPFAAEPTVGVSKYLKIVNGILTEKE